MADFNEAYAQARQSQPITPGGPRLFYIVVWESILAGLMVLLYRFAGHAAYRVSLLLHGDIIRAVVAYPWAKAQLFVFAFWLFPLLSLIYYIRLLRREKKVEVVIALEIQGKNRSRMEVENVKMHAKYASSGGRVAFVSAIVLQLAAAAVAMTSQSGDLRDSRMDYNLYRRGQYMQYQGGITLEEELTRQYYSHYVGETGNRRSGWYFSLHYNGESFPQWGLEQFEGTHLDHRGQPWNTNTTMSMLYYYWLPGELWDGEEDQFRQDTYTVYYLPVNGIIVRIEDEQGHVRAGQGWQPLPEPQEGFWLYGDRPIREADYLWGRQFLSPEGQKMLDLGEELYRVWAYPEDFYWSPSKFALPLDEDEMVLVRNLLNSARGCGTRKGSMRDNPRSYQEYHSAADDVAAGISQDATDAEKALYLARYLAENTGYRNGAKYSDDRAARLPVSAIYDDTVSSAHSLLVEGQGDCIAYSMVFQHLARKVGLNALIVEGKLPAQRNWDNDYYWNMVEVDGAWYHVDVSYMNLAPELDMGYFLATDSFMEETRAILGVYGCGELPLPQTPGEPYQAAQQGGQS